jgi:hypothetical protein
VRGTCPLIPAAIGDPCHSRPRLQIVGTGLAWATAGHACRSIYSGESEMERTAEMTWDNDGRATFSYGEERIAGQAHVIWRRIGTHAIFTPPPGP